MDGLGIAAVIGEMRDVVQGSVVRSIYQPSPARFVWQLFSRGTLRLFIAPTEATIHLTEHAFAYPKRPRKSARKARASTDTHTVC